MIGYNKITKRFTFALSANFFNCCSRVVTVNYMLTCVALKVERSWGCLAAHQLFPKPRPFRCEPVKGAKTVVQCCYEDMCNLEY